MQLIPTAMISSTSRASSKGLGCRLPSAREISGAGDRQPARLPTPVDLGHQRLDLGQTGNRLEGENVDARLDEQLDPWAMPVT